MEAVDHLKVNMDLSSKTKNLKKIELFHSALLKENQIKKAIYHKKNAENEFKDNS